MATSLAEQLKRLAVPQTSLLNQTKKRSSLLFDPKEAAGLNKDTVYQIGLDGLDGLKSKNPVFAQFENTLFHVTSKDFERAVQTAEANDKLNKNVTKFILQLSPYFMLYDSYKALEWLIYRYHIHEYNKEDLLILILPYHETNIFVRTLQLLNLKEANDKWHWLHTLQRPGIHLPKDTLYTHAANDPYFVKFLSRYIISVVAEHDNPHFLTVIFNFYCATFVGAIEYSKEINEAQVTQMMPALLKGLKSNIADFCASNYIIMARLLAKTDLSEKLLLKIVDKVTTFPVDILRSEAVTLLLLIYQLQKDFKTISLISLQRLLGTDWFTKMLQKLDQDGMHILPLVEVLQKEGVKAGLISNEDNSDEDLSCDMFQAIDNFFQHFGDDFNRKVNVYLKRVSLKSKKNVDKNLKLEKFLERFGENSNLKIEAHLNFVISQSKYADANFQLKSLLTIQKLLSEGQDLKANCLDLNNLTVPFLLVLLVSNECNVRKEAFKVLNILDENTQENNYSLLVKAVLAQKQKVLDLEKTVMQSIFQNTGMKTILNTLVGLVQKDEIPVSLKLGLIKILCLVNNAELFLAIVRFAKYILAAAKLNPALKGQSEIALTSATLILKQVDRETFANLSENIKKSLLDCVLNFATQSQKSALRSTANNFLKNIEISFVAIIEFVSSIDFNLQLQYLHKFFERFDNIDLKINAYLNVANYQIKNLDSNVQLNCLVKVKKLLGDLVDISKCMSYNNFMVPHLLTSLRRPEAKIREQAVDILNVLFLIVSTSGNNYSYLLKGVLAQKEEILLDHEQIPAVIRNIFHENSAKTNSTLDVLVGLVQKNDVPISLVSGLIQVLSLVNNADVFLAIVKYANNILETSDQNKIQRDAALSPAISVLNQVDREFFASLNEAVKKTLLDCVVDVVTKAEDPELLSAANHFLKKIDLDSKMVIEALTKMRDVQSPKLSETKRKRRISIIPTVDILDTNAWKKGVTVLEFIQDKKKIRNTQLLLPVLFDLLKKCLDFDEQDNVEYTKQLILSSILHSCNKTYDEKLPDNVFNMELVVQCITASKNPQTHHHALLVLAHASSIVPQQVLHHIMTNFTFIGSPVLRHDDAYSFQIISKIIDTIIPLLVKDGSDKSICNILRVFVDAILDVPEHRRSPLYKQLLSTIGPQENLHIFLLLIFQGHVVHGNAEKQKQAKNTLLADNTPKRLDIAAGLSREFSPYVVISNCIKIIEYLRRLPIDKSDAMETDEVIIFNIKAHTPKQLRHYKYTIVFFISSLLSSKEFVHQIASLPDDDLQQLEPLYKDLIINVLTYVQTLSKIADKSVNTPQAQYWKVMLHHSYDILDSVNALLTPQMFLLVIRGLMDHNLGTVRRRAMELLNTKLKHDSSFFADCEESELMEILPPLLKVLKHLKSEEIVNDEELIIQTALLSLKLLVKLLAPNNPQKFTQILEFITELIKLGNVSGNILASLILCLAELCSNLRAHAISGLNNFMPAILKILRVQKHQAVPDLLLLSIITAVHKILDSLALFLSPYLNKLLVELSILESKFHTDENEQKLGTFGAKLLSMKQKLGSLIPARVLVPAIEQSYNALTKKNNFSSVGPLMSILSENLINLKGPEIQENLSELTAFFLNALQFRVEVSKRNVAEGNVSLAQANDVETHVIKSLTVLILKLSETTFRPLYYKLYDWVRSEIKSERVITFYALSHGIANSLKGLFVLFAGHFLNNAASILDSCNTVKSDVLYFDANDKNVLLLENVLKTLNAVFLYDTQKFINKDRFEILMQPIVDQIENTLGSEDASVERAKNLVVPCIVNLAVATADDSLWKQMNYQILLKMRHNSASIRLIALQALLETCKKLGEDFLPLLPETIPFLAELLEDENEGVEQASRKAVQELEKVLGEPLEKYF